MPRDSFGNSAIGERRLVRAVFLCIGEVHGDLKVLEKLIRELDDEGIFRSEGSKDVHIDVVALQIPAIREAKIAWLNDVVIPELNKRASGEFPLPPMAMVDPSKGQRLVKISKAEADAEFRCLTNSLRADP